MNLKRKIAEAKKALDLARNRWRSKPDVLAARKVLRKIEEEAQALDYAEIEREEANLRALEKELAEKEKQAAKELPSTVAEFLRRIKKGVNWGAEFRFKWISNNARFCIVTRPCHFYWNGIGAPRAFAPTRHTLIDLSKMPPEPKMESGLKVYHLCLIREFEGRLTNRMLEDMISSAKREPNTCG